MGFGWIDLPKDSHEWSQTYFFATFSSEAKLNDTQELDCHIIKCKFAATCTVKPRWYEHWGTVETVRIKQVEYKESIGVFFPQGQSIMSIKMRCRY